MSSLLHPSAAARVKAAFDACELVARTVSARRRAAKAKPKAPAPRSTMIYERDSVRVAATCD